MKTPDEIKKGLDHCGEDGCKDCPYVQDCTMMDGFSELAKDSLAYIQQLEAERDAAVKSLRGRCFECKHNKTSVCLICSKDKELKYWQWRGVQKEVDHNAE